MYSLNQFFLLPVKQTQAKIFMESLLLSAVREASKSENFNFELKPVSLSFYFSLAHS